MAKITKDMFEKSYDIYHTSTKDINPLVQMGMNETSAKMTMKWYEYIFSGKLYERTVSTIQVEFILEKLYLERKYQRLELVLESLNKYINYYSHKKLKKVKSAIKEYENKLANINIVYPDEIKEKSLIEGAKKQIIVNAYERNSQARQECIEHYGCKCQVCDFDFEKIYGEIGKDFIHVHHVIDISTIGKNYQVNPIKDLIPVCPNCHAMLHKRKPAYTPEEIKSQIFKRTYNKS